MMNESTDDWKKLKLVRRHFMKYFKQMSGDGKNWPTEGYTVKDDGIWVNSNIHSHALLAGEAEPFYAHPTDDLSTPALIFPCNFYQASSFFDFIFEETGLIFYDLKLFIVSGGKLEIAGSDGLEKMWQFEYQTPLIFKNELNLDNEKIANIPSSWTKDEGDSSITIQKVQKKFKLEKHRYKEELAQKLIENWGVVTKAIEFKRKKENQKSDVSQTAIEQTEELNTLKELSRNWEVVALVYGLEWMNTEFTKIGKYPTKINIANKINEIFKSFDIRNKHYQENDFIKSLTIEREALKGITGRNPKGR